MTQLNVSCLLPGLSPQINPSASGQVSGGPQNGPASFLNLLGGLALGSQASGKNAVNQEAGIFNLKDSLSDEEMDFIAGLITDSDLAITAPAVVLFNKGDQIPVDGLTSENMETDENKPVLLTRVFGMPGEILSETQIPDGESSEDLNADSEIIFAQKNPSEVSEILMNSTVDKSADITGGSKRDLSIMEMASVADLENLEVGEKLTLVEPDETGKIEKINFLKSDQPQIFNDKSFTKFEIEMISDNKNSRFEAVLVNPEGNSAKTAADIAALIPEDSAKDARLMVIYSSGSPVEFDPLVEQKNGGQIAQAFQSIKMIGDDALAQLRQLELKEQNAGKEAERAILDESTSEDQEIFKPVTGSDGKSEFKQTFLNQNQEPSNFIRLNHESVKVSGLENFADKLGEAQVSSTADQTAGDVSEISDVDETSTAKNSFQYRNVEFKLQPPSGGTKIPENGYFRIKLEPESLGKIDVELKVEHDRMIASMKVESPLARQVVEANLPQLKETLSSHGIKVDGITVDLNNNGFNQNLDSHQASENSRGHNTYGRLDNDPGQADSSDVASPKINGILNLKGNLSLLA